MAGCSRQPVRTRPDHRLLLALILSTALHLVGGIATTRVSVAPDAATRTSSHDRWLRSGAMALEFADPHATEDPAQSSTDLAQLPPPAPTPEDPEPITLTLGIDGSKQRTENMIGFREATEHSAMLSSIDQPALDPEAGDSPMSMASDTPVGMTVEKALSPVESSPSAAAPAQPDARQFGPPAPTLAQAALESITAARPDRGDALEMREEVEARSEPSLPNPADSAGNLADQPPPTERVISDRTREFQAKTTAGDPQPEPIPQGPSVMAAPPAPATPAGRPSPIPSASPPGAQPGTKPGIRSDKESDPSSKVRPIEVRFGQTVAGDGVEIVTRRPREPLFTKLTRVIATPENPGVEATFDATGKVVDVKLVKSSGYAEVDEPVVNMVYTWRARGPKLAAMAAGDPELKFRLNFLILVR
ncbi:MAG: hypothetical protein ACK4WH_08625 [Phycisphaerales bacterium]